MKKWNILSSTTPESIEEIFYILQKNRGITDEVLKKRQNFNIKDLTAEDIGIDKKSIDTAARRIKRAIDKREQIVIFGDYDADGICATTILWEEIYTKTKNVMPYIPDRKSEGYGLSITGIDNLLEKYPDTKLILTVDNGITAIKATKYATDKKIDVIITDHHTKEKKDPDAYAVVHTQKTAGAGVAWFLARQLSSDTQKISEKLDLVALANIADMVPLVGINFQIVKEGLLRLNATKRIGLRTLMKEADITDKRIGTYEVGFALAPRLNAAGRMSHALDSLRLLCTKKIDNAQILAKKLNAQNRQRQVVMDASTKYAIELAHKTLKDNRVVIVEDKDFEEGVIGLVASKLMDEFYLPAIVIAKGNKMSKGSARSIPGVDITKILKKHRKHLESIGGHPMAAGFSIKTENIHVFKEAIIEEAKNAVSDDMRTRQLRIDSTLKMLSIDEELHLKIQDLYPFGIGNMEPVFVSRSVVIKKIDIIGKEKNHVKLVVAEDDKSIESIGFGIAKDFNKSLDEKIDIAYSIDINEWRGQRKIVLKLKDFREEEG